MVVFNFLVIQNSHNKRFVDIFFLTFCLQCTQSPNVVVFLPLMQAVTTSGPSVCTGRPIRPHIGCKHESLLWVKSVHGGVVSFRHLLRYWNVYVLDHWMVGKSICLPHFLFHLKTMLRQLHHHQKRMDDGRNVGPFRPQSLRCYRKRGCYCHRYYHNHRDRDDSGIA